ncbi:MAG: hypothetical protein DI543_02745, partial [Bradyrhizobium icense]
MATLSTIPTVTRILVPLGPGEFDNREFHALPSFMRFLQETLPTLQRGVLAAEETPKQQMDSVLRKWNSGKPMRFQRSLSTLRPVRHSVWEMKTVDLRIFGWIYRPKVFVAAFAGFADDYKAQDGNPPKELYDISRDRVVWLREQLDLDPPLFVTGEFNA